MSISDSGGLMHHISFGWILSLYTNSSPMSALLNFCNFIWMKINIEMGVLHDEISFK